MSEITTAVTVVHSFLLGGNTEEFLGGRSHRVHSFTGLLVSRGLDLYSTFGGGRQGTSGNIFTTFNIFLAGCDTVLGGFGFTSFF